MRLLITDDELKLKQIVIELFGLSELEEIEAQDGL
jgi:hypothetical protein